MLATETNLPSSSSISSGRPRRLQATVWLLVALLLSTYASCQKKNQIMKSTTGPAPGMEIATFGSGCFWCTEAIFQNVDGVHSVESGYSGGHVKNPSYKEVCTGATGHAEVIRISFDPSKISFEDLLEIFWQTHDPTTRNRQGADVGTQYRSVIFYHNDAQREAAEFYKQRLEDEKVFDKPIVTEITAATEFFKAEDYHQNYYSLNSNAPYCTYVIQPKLEKFKKAFSARLKKQN